MRKYPIMALTGLLLAGTPATAHILMAADSHGNVNSKNGVSNFLSRFDNCRLVGNCVPTVGTAAGPLDVLPAAHAQIARDSAAAPRQSVSYTSERGEGGEMPTAPEASQKSDPDVRPGPAETGGNPVIDTSASINRTTGGDAGAQTGGPAEYQAEKADHPAPPATLLGKGFFQKRWPWFLLAIAALLAPLMLWSRRKTSHDAPGVKTATSVSPAAGKQNLDKNSGAQEAKPLSIYFPDLNRSYALRPGTMLLGSAPASDIVLDEPGIARVHAEFCTNGNCIVKDAIVAAGVRLNGKALMGADTLKPGDVLEFGPVRAVVRKHGE